MMNVDLTGQTAVVTGASRGIGLAVTRALAASGARVVAGALHSSAELSQLAAEGSVTISELDLAQLSTLVAVVRGPTLYDPRRNPLQAIERRNLVLRILVAQRLVPVASARQAMVEPLGVQPRPGGRYYPAYLDLVRRDLGSEYRQRDLTGQGLQIFTSLDPRVQEEAERAVERTIPRVAAKHRGDEQLQAAVVVTAPQTGDVLAIVGGSEVG